MSKKLQPLWLVIETTGGRCLCAYLDNEKAKEYAGEAANDGVGVRIERTTLEVFE
jgi:hypothetical protein